MNNVEKGNDQEPILSNTTSSPKHQTGKEHIQLRRHKIKTIRVESQWDSSFPADGHRTSLNKDKTSLNKVDEKTMIRNRYNRSKKINNDQELIQSDPTSCPQNQKEILKYIN